MRTLKQEVKEQKFTPEIEARALVQACLTLSQSLPQALSTAQDIAAIANLEPKNSHEENRVSVKLSRAAYDRKN